MRLWLFIIFILCASRHYSQDSSATKTPPLKNKLGVSFNGLYLKYKRYSPYYPYDELNYFGNSIGVNYERKRHLIEASVGFFYGLSSEYNNGPSFSNYRNQNFNLAYCFRFNKWQKKFSYGLCFNINDLRRNHHSITYFDFPPYDKFELRDHQNDINIFTGIFIKWEIKKLSFSIKAMISSHELQANNYVFYKNNVLYNSNRDLEGDKIYFDEWPTLIELRVNYYFLKF